MGGLGARGFVDLRTTTSTSGRFSPGAGRGSSSSCAASSTTTTPLGRAGLLKNSVTHGGDAIQQCKWWVLGEGKRKKVWCVACNGYKGERVRDRGCEIKGEAKIAGRRDAGRGELAKYRQSCDAKKKELGVCSVDGFLSWPAGEVDVDFAGRKERNLSDGFAGSRSGGCEASWH